MSELNAHKNIWRYFIDGKTTSIKAYSRTSIPRFGCKCGYNKLTLIHVFKILFSFEFLSNEIFEINSFENSNFTLFTSTLFAVTRFQFIITIIN